MRQTSLFITAAAFCALPVLAAEALAPPADLPKELQPSFKTFAERCSQCHTPARAYSSPHVTKKDWEALVGRMARKPGAAISRDDQKRIVEYLTWYSARYKRK